MIHRCHWKATVWILFGARSTLFSTFSRSALALQFQSPRRFCSKAHSTVPSRHPLFVWPSLRATKDFRETVGNGVNDNTMILRVRSNVGTVKLTIEDEEKATEATIRENVLEDLRGKTSNAYTITQDLSFDPSGVRKIDLSKTLSEQGIRHGCMVYCRVEEAISQDPNNSGSNNEAGVDGIEPIPNLLKKESRSEMRRKKGATKMKNDGVIDLIDSSDEEETNANADEDDDDDVQVISPPRKIQKTNKTMSSENPISKSRKRQRSSTDEKSSATDSIVTGSRKNSYPSFQIASYNVWFGPPDPEARQVFPKERMAGILKSLRVASRDKKPESCPLLFVGLQELTPNLVQYLQPLFQTIGYKLCTQPLGGLGPSYGIGIAVPEDVNVLDRRFVPYQNSIQGRGFLFVRTSTLLFVTTHLESWCGPQFTGAKEREVQIAEAADFCREQLYSVEGLELAIIAGDLNWDDERKRKSSEAPNRNLLSILPERWKDAGTPFDYTYDSKENPMLNGNLRRRLDRCLYLTSPPKKAMGYKSTGLQKIGKESVPNLVWNKRNTYNDTVKKMAVNPSDHFGIMIHFDTP